MIHLTLKRDYFTSTETMGKLSLNGQFFCYTLEDADRGLQQGMTLDEVKKKKIMGRTAIPTGDYNVQITYSPRFKKNLPLLLNVKGYEGVRIHAGNTHQDTEGCILVGNTRTEHAIGNSRVALERLMAALGDDKNIKLKID